MADSELEVRKKVNEDARSQLGDQINVRQAELTRLSEEYEAIVDEEENERKAEGYVKLYDVDRKQWVSLSRKPASLFFFDHIDGMYSYCLTLQGDVIHVGASSWVLVHDIALEAPHKGEAG